MTALFTIKIKTPADEVFELRVNGDMSVQMLKEAVLTHRHPNQTEGSSQSNMTVKLIAAGKLLQPPSAKLSSFGITDGSFVHAVFGKAPILHPAADSLMDVEVGGMPGRELRGFDRLQEGPHGISADQVEAIRSAFSEEVSAYAATHPPSQSSSGEEEDSLSYRLRMEEEWSQAQSSTSEFAMNLRSNRIFSELLRSNIDTRYFFGGRRGVEIAGASTTAGEDAPQEIYLGTYRDFLYGYAMGFILGVFMLVGIWDGNVSYRQKVGILCGVFSSLLMSSTYSHRSRPASPPSSPSSSSSSPLQQVPLTPASATTAAAVSFGSLPN